MNNQLYTQEENKIIEIFKQATEESVAQIKSDNNQFEAAIKNFGQAWLNMEYALEDLNIDSFHTKERTDFIDKLQVEGIVYLIKTMEKEIPEYAKLETSDISLKNDIRTRIGEEVMKLNVNQYQRENLIHGLVTYEKPQVIISPEAKIETNVETPVLVKDFSESLKVIEKLDTLEINKKFNKMTNNEIFKTVSESGQIFAQEVKEGKIDLKNCFEKFSTVWYAIPFTKEKKDISLETLREFKYNLAQILPEHAVEKEGKKDLSNNIKQDLAIHLVNVEYCNAELRDVIIMAITDFDRLVDKKFVKPNLNKNENSAIKLKNN